MIFNLKNNIHKINYRFFNVSSFNTSKQQIIKYIIEKQNHIITKKKGYSDFIIEEYTKKQNDFCQFSSKYINYKYEELIKLTNFSFKGSSYQMYVYKKFDKYMSNYIIRTGKYEPGPMSNFLEALKYYGKKKKKF